MALHRLINNFSGGEISPLLDARIDLQKYDTSCRTLQNMRPLPWGGATFRAGTLFAGACKYPSRLARLLPFNYSTGVTYVLELGDLYMRFYTAGVLIEASSTFAWVTATAYRVSDNVTHLGVNYRCVVNHTSGTFATDYTTSHFWVVAGSTVPYEVVAPFTEAELFGVQFKEINDVLYLVHENHEPFKLSRVSDANWTLAEVAWKYPALLDENTVLTKKLTLVATGASGLVMDNKYRIETVGDTNWTLLGAAANTVGEEFTANATGTGTGSGTALQINGGGVWLYSVGFNQFTADHVGAYFELRHLRNSSTLEADISGSIGTISTGTIKVKGDWTLTTSQLWYGVLNLMRSTDGGTTWEVYRQFKSSSNHNVSATGTETAEVFFRLDYSATGDPYGGGVWVGTAPNAYVKATAILEVADAYIAGVVRVTAVNSPTWAIVDVIYAVERSEETWTWSEGAWSDYQGFPRAVGFYEQRMLFAGTTRKPNTLWGSVTADFENFQYSDLDDAAVAYQFADTEQNPIVWLAALLRIHAGSTGGEYAVGSGNTDEPLTPANVTVRRQSSYGGAAQPALTIDNGIIFLQRQGRRIRELRELSPYSAQEEPQSTDLTLLAEHITLGGITQMDFARLPDPQLYAVRADGTLCVMTYNRDQNINAWARYITDGAFESVAAIYGSPSDVVYCIVKRSVGGQDVRYVEAFAAELADKTNGVYLDCAVAVTNGSPSTVVSGLDHLIGIRVTAVADGMVCPSLLVDNSGQITLPIAATVVRAGLTYMGILKPMKLDSQMGNGTSQGRKRSISELCIRFKDSLGCTYGNALETDQSEGFYASEIPFRKNDDYMDQSPPLFSGDKSLKWEGGADQTASIVISQQQPLPMTVLGLFAKLNYMGD